MRDAANILFQADGGKLPKTASDIGKPIALEQPSAPELANLIDSLTPSETYALKHDRFDPKGWEPKNPNAKIVCDMIDKGLFTRSDGRCGFERFKDSFIVPTPLCLVVRDYLTTLPAQLANIGDVK